MKYKCNQLNVIIEYSETMLRDAAAGNWRNVFKVESQRSNLLKELFAIPFSTKEKEECSEKIQHILDINKELESITAKAREKIKTDANAMNKGRHAVGAYAQHSG